MDRGTIEERSARYLHRVDFTTADFDYAFAVTTKELGQVLRCPENETLLEVDSLTITNPFPLPANCRQIRSIEYDGSGGPYTVEAVTREFENKWLAAGNPAAFYTVLNGELYFRPFQAMDFRIWYWEEPDVIGAGPTATNRVLSAYPDVYLSRVMAELSKVTQDLELVEGYLGAFGSRVTELNLQARQRQWSNPQMRAG